MKKYTLYNAIFPLYVVWLLPPLLFYVLIGNFIIDAMVLFFALSSFGVFSVVRPRMYSYVLKAWIFGLLADAIGAGILFIIPFFVKSFNVYFLFQKEGYATELFVRGIEGNPTVLWFFMWALYLAVIACVAYLIFLFNNRLAQKYGVDTQSAWKTAVLMATITLPWTWLMPLEWFVR